jgi:hypothetical protein
MDNLRLVRENFIIDFDIRVLNGKILEMKVAENCKYLVVLGIDKETNDIYVLEERNKEQNKK